MSASISGTNYELMKLFLSRLVGKIDIDSGNTRVGLVTFATNVGTTIQLNAHASAASLQSVISSLTQSRAWSRGTTNTADALAHVRTNMSTSAAGDRSNVPNVVIVLTDGRSTRPTATQVSIKLLACFLSEKYDRYNMKMRWFGSHYAAC